MPNVIHLGYGHKITVKTNVGIEEIHQRVMDGIERVTQFA